MAICTNQSTSCISAQCTAQNIGVANSLFVSLIQAVLVAQCSISPPLMWPTDYGKIARNKEPETFDFIVIGAGTAGSVVASRLSENPKWKVLLLEAGDDPPIESEIPNLPLSLQKTRADWAFYAQSSRACQANIGGCFWPRGKALGGSSSTNFLVYVRGNERDYNRWEQEFKITGWNYETALKYFKKSEANQQASFVAYESGRYHSANGLQKIDFMGNLSSFEEMVVAAAAEKGHPFVNDINADKLSGFTNLQATYFQGRRWSAAKSFLIPAKNRTNLRIIKNAFVTKILINEMNVAYGVKFKYNGKKMMAFSRKETILSAGAVMSPIVLMKSGVGPRKQLQKYKIPIKSDLTVGENLIDHLYTMVWFKLKPFEPPSPVSNIDSIYNLAVHNSGALVSAGVLSGFINVANDSIYPDTQILSHYYRQGDSGLKQYLDLYQFKDNFKKKLLQEQKQHDIVGFTVVLLLPKSRGYIRLNGTSSCNKPIIKPKYLSHSNDMEVMLKAVKHKLSFEKTAAYRERQVEFIWMPIEECDRFPFKSDDYLKCYIKYNTATTYHPLGTSKMGNFDSDDTAVVDSFLRVRNIKSLRQIDAGIMPYTVSGNINAAVLMIGEYGSQIIKNTHSKP